MGSYFTLELDTTPPTVEIYSPQYTTKEINTYVTIQCDESLSSYQDIYFIDSQGFRHNFSFLLQDNKYEGDVVLTNVSLGIGTLYCRVEDVVGNRSDTYSKPINVREQLITLKLTIDEKSFSISNSDKSFILNNNESTHKLTLTERSDD